MGESVAINRLAFEKKFLKIEEWEIHRLTLVLHNNVMWYDYRTLVKSV